MRALFETTFDIVYLVTVTTLGVLMIRQSKPRSQYRLFGWMAVVLGAGDAFHLVPRAIALCTTGLDHYTTALGIGKWITSITMTVFYVLLYFVWRKRYAIRQHKRLERFGVQSGRPAYPALHAAPKRVAQRQTSIALGRDPQHSVRPARLADHRTLRVQSETNERQAVSLDGAHDRAQLRLLHSRRLVGRANPGHRHAHDS